MKHNFYMGQELYWHVKEPWAEDWIRCVITEIHEDEDYAIARTEGNRHPGKDDMNLWIDSDNEMDFFDAAILKQQIAGL